MRTKASVLLLVVFISITCCSCLGMAAIRTDSGHHYLLDKAEDGGGDLELSCGSFYNVDADTLRSYSTEGKIVHGQARSRKSTAKTGAIAIEAATGEILCIVYE